MKKSIKVLICVLCLVFCLGLFAGCDGETGGAATATPAPTDSNGSTSGTTSGATTGASSSSDGQDPYLRPRDESLENAIKEGETYRYFIYTTNDPNNPFEADSDENREFNLNRKSHYEAAYGITIEYVVTSSDWFNSFAAAAYAGTPATDIFHAGGPFTMYTQYNYQGTPGAILEPLSQYKQYADFEDPEWFDTTSQEVTTFGEDLYFAVPNQVGIASVSLNLVVMFNKEILAGAGYEDSEIYDMWRNNEWDWDAFREIAQATTDLDNDIHGLTLGQNNSLMWGLLPSNDAAILSQVEDAQTGQSYWAFSGGSDNALEAWDFMIQMGKDNSVLLDHNTGEDTLFRAGNIAMMVTYVNRADTLTNFRQYPEFGIVPVPIGPKTDSYVSSCNWFTPLCVFKNTANPAGSVQVLSEYCVPQYAKSSEEAQAQFEAGAVGMVCDEESIEVLRSIPDISVTEPYIIYWNTPTFNSGDSQLALCNLFWNYNQAFVDGSQTPSVLFESVEGALNQTLRDAQVILS